MYNHLDTFTLVSHQGYELDFKTFCLQLSHDLLHTVTGEETSDEETSTEEESDQDDNSQSESEDQAVDENKECSDAEMQSDEELNEDC